MRTPVKLVSYGVALALALVVASAALAAGKDQFEGKWAIALTPEDGGKPLRDTLVFRAEKITSELGKKEGFDEAPYEVDLRGGQIGTFTANVKAKTGKGLMKWTGTASVGSLKGTLTWVKADGTTTEYSYTGEKAVK